jgi:nicotinate-nucleotide adenylyltransferase
LEGVGILGGTFDPIHFGHLRLAQDMAEGLGLDTVHFVPAAHPPHRVPPQCCATHRAEMVRMAIADNPLFVLDLREYERSGPSYMYDTLASLRTECGAHVALYLILGADAFLGLPTWHRWLELFELAHIAVAHRPGHVIDPGHPLFSFPLRNEWRHRHTDRKPVGPCGCIVSHKITALDISSSVIRQMLSNHHSPRYLLPDAVLDYITRHRLYESGAV